VATDLSADRQAFEALEDDLAEIAECLEDWLRDATRALGIAAQVDGRVKGVGSFLRKILRTEASGKGYANPIEDMSDKVGVRADVLTTRDREKLCAHVEAEGSKFKILKRDDKLDNLKSDTLGYQGVHFDIEPLWPPADRRRHLHAEIQVRTASQSAWAQISHDLAYKVPEDLIPKSEKRRLMRLTALVELFDEEVDRTRTNLLNNPRYPIGRILEALRVALLQVAGYQADADPELTQLVVGSLLRHYTPEQLSGLEELIPAFISRQEPKLRATYGEYHDSSRHLLLFQPEAILVFMQLESAPFALKEAWESMLPVEELRSLANVWGVALPDHA